MEMQDCYIDPEAFKFNYLDWQARNRSLGSNYALELCLLSLLPCLG